MTKTSKKTTKKPLTSMSYNKHGHAYWHRRRIADEERSKADAWYNQRAVDPRVEGDGRLYPIIDEE